MAEPSDTIGALSPVLWLKLSEASGTTAANSGSSGSGDNGTVHNGGAFGATTILNGPTDTALALDGVDDYVDVTTSPLQGAVWSLSILFQTTVSDTDVHDLVYQDEYAGENIRIWIDGNDGLLGFSLSTSDGNLETGGSGWARGAEQDQPWNDGATHMFTLSHRADQQLYMWFDGYSVGPLDLTYFGSDGIRSDAPTLYLGANTGAYEYLPGSISHFFVTLDELTDAEVQAVWAAAGFPPEPVPYGGVDESSIPPGPTPDAVIVDVGGFDAGSRVPGPALLATTEVPGDPYVPAATVALYAVDGVTFVAQLPDVWGVSWQDPVNDTGAGAFVMSLYDPVAASVAEGQFVRCSLYGAEVFTWRVDTISRASIVQGEEADEVLEVSGQGWVTLLDTTTVYPAGGVAKVPAVPDRSWSFASPDYPLPGWILASVIQEQKSIGIWKTVELGKAVAAPSGWPFQLGTAKWIWSRPDAIPPNGKSYFRATFTLAAETNVIVIATADNLFTLYLNGVPLLGDNANTAAWQEHRQGKLTLPAGDHTLGAVVENTGLQAGLLVAVYTENDDGEFATTVKVTNETWLANDYPTVEPGWTPGQIVLNLIAESQARGQLAGLTYDFSTLTDTDGVAWLTIPEFVVAVGDSLLDVLMKLRDAGWIDFSMAPSSPRLSLWKQDGKGAVARAATYAKGLNIGEMDHGQAQRVVNRLLVRYGAGMFVLDDTASQTATGMIVEDFLTLDAADETEARRLAQRSLDQATEQEPAIAMGIEPRLVTADRPYADWDLGDTVLAPDRAGVATRYRVLSITVTQDDETGDTSLALELNKRAVSLEEDRVNLLRELGSGVVGKASGSQAVAASYFGGSAYSPTRTPTIDKVVLPTPQGAGGGDEIVFSYPGTVNTLVTAPPWSAPYDLRIYEVVMLATTAGATDVSITANGSTFKLNDGETATITAASLGLLQDAVLTVELTNVGSSDVVGLTVILRYRAA